MIIKCIAWAFAILNPAPTWATPPGFTIAPGVYRGDRGAAATVTATKYPGIQRVEVIGPAVARADGPAGWARIDRVAFFYEAETGHAFWPQAKLGGYEGWDEGRLARRMDQLAVHLYYVDAALSLRRPAHLLGPDQPPFADLRINRLAGLVARRDAGETAPVDLADPLTRVARSWFHGRIERQLHGDVTLTFEHEAAAPAGAPSTLTNPSVMNTFFRTDRGESLYLRIDKETRHLRLVRFAERANAAETALECQNLLLEAPAATNG